MLLKGGNRNNCISENIPIMLCQKHGWIHAKLQTMLQPPLLFVCGRGAIGYVRAATLFAGFARLSLCGSHTLQSGRCCLKLRRWLAHQLWCHWFAWWERLCSLCKLQVRWAQLGAEEDLHPHQLQTPELLLPDCQRNAVSIRPSERGSCWSVQHRVNKLLHRSFPFSRWFGTTDLSSVSFLGPFFFF